MRPSVVASVVGSAKNARYRSEFPSMSASLRRVIRYLSSAETVTRSKPFSRRPLMMSGSASAV